MAKKKSKDNTGALIFGALGVLLLVGGSKPSTPGTTPGGSGTGGGSSSGGIVSKYYTINDVQRSQLGTQNNITEQFGALTETQKRDINAFIKIVLDRLTDSLGSKLVIESWWRSKRVNDLAGGEEDSYHLKGVAIDFFYKGPNGVIDNAKVIKALYNLQLPFTELVLYGSKTGPKSLHLAFDYQNPIEKEILFKKPDGSYERLSNEFIYENFIA